MPVAFPFGFGLSYTTFDYTDLEVSDSGVAFTVTNTGQVPGAEVAQMYVGRAGTTGVVRPARELKGFAKVQLAPAESGRVTIAFDDLTFRHFDTTAGAWAVETGNWTVEVGGHVDDPRLTARHHVDGTVATRATPAVAVPHDVRAVAAGVPDGAFSALLGRALPAAEDRGRALRVNDPLGEMSRARSPLARLANRVLVRLIARSEARGAPDLNLLFIHGMPFRAIAKMSNGVVSAEMVDAILVVVNGHAFRGFAALVTAWLRALRSGRRLRRALASPAPERTDRES